MKAFHLFLLAVVIGIPIATAFNCTKLKGEQEDFCDYIEDLNWNQKTKDEIITEAITSKNTNLKGNFKSTLGNKVPTKIKLNKVEKSDIISKNNKIILIDTSKISLLGYIIYAFLKKYYILIQF